MTDIVERLINYRPENEWGDKVHHTICTEASGEISGLRTELRAKEAEAIGYLRAVGELQERFERLRKALDFYADELTWADTNPKNDPRITVLVPSPSFAEIDKGKVARAALEDKRGEQNDGST